MQCLPNKNPYSGNCVSILFDVVASIMSISCCAGSLNLLKKILQFHVLLKSGNPCLSRVRNSSFAF